MAYADYTYYTDTYYGETYDEADVERNLEIAKNAIDLLSNREIEIGDLSTFQQDNLKMANCILAEHYLINGHTFTGASQVSLLSFSYSGAKVPKYPEPFIKSMLRAGLLKNYCKSRE